MNAPFLALQAAREQARHRARRFSRFVTGVALVLTLVAFVVIPAWRVL